MKSSGEAMTETIQPLGETLDESIQWHVYSILNKHKCGKPVPESVDFWTDNIGEVVEKLMIVHIRAWHLEDQIHDGYDDDAKLAATKKKLDVLWKKKRPALVAALNRMIDDAVLHNKSLREESVKKYRGFE
jgi:hypothetical protein